ncbi:MAG: inositol monophosphatase family protein [Enterobacterales bacterium]
MNSPLLNIAVHIIRTAGNAIVKYYNLYEYNKTSEFIQKMYNKMECIFIDEINRFYPNDYIYFKNKNNIFNTTRSNIWIIEILDGMINFIKHYPYFAISIAVIIKNKIEIAVIYDPIHDELFTAVRGENAKLNEYRLRCSKDKNLENAIISISNSFKNIYKNKEDYKYEKILNKLIVECNSFRYTGSSALDLAYIAAGRIDCGLKKINIKSNFYSGELLIKESGGLYIYLNENINNTKDNIIIIGNPNIVNIILNKINFINKNK